MNYIQNEDDEVVQSESAPQDKEETKQSPESQECKLSDRLSERNEDGVFVIEEIVGHRKRKNRSMEFQVKWEGYTKTTWEPSKTM